MVKTVSSFKSHDISNIVSCSRTTKFLMTKTTMNIYMIVEGNEPLSFFPNGSMLPWS